MYSPFKKGKRQPPLNAISPTMRAFTRKKRSSAPGYAVEKDDDKKIFYSKGHLWSVCWFLVLLDPEDCPLLS
jgi:hypothetical protein